MLYISAGSCFSDLYDLHGTDLGKSVVFSLLNCFKGKGSYGSVAKATDKRTGAVRAVKTIYKPKIENVTRLKREILIMKALDHPNIIRLFEVYEDEKHLYFIIFVLLHFCNDINWRLRWGRADKL